jgi:GT2 family glycosyltransferase/predicted Zn-dependent protease
VYYSEDNLEALLNHFLEHEDHRRAIAEAARAKVGRFTFETLWRNQLTLIDREWPALSQRLPQRPAWGGDVTLLGRCWQALSNSQAGGDPALLTDLATALSVRPRSATLHNALGVVTSLAAKVRGRTWAAHADRAAGYFRRALEHDPTHIMAGLNLVEALVGLEKKKEAIDQGWKTLNFLDRHDPRDPDILEGCHFPVAFDHFRVEWERAAWANAGNRPAEAHAKRVLIRWRIHSLLAELTDELAHHYEAVAARPDLPLTRASLGCSLGRVGRPVPAVPHLRQAVADAPFDRDAARALFHALGQSADAHGQRLLARDRRLLAKAAPQLLKAEKWFTDCAPVGDELASIIILCCNERELTQGCLESVVRCTRAPYELILVDNGSADDTPEYLKEFAGQPGPARVDILRNESNRGFAGGCNQAITKATGRYVVFLNNDTIVGDGWLDGLIGQALEDWPHVGLVGAVSNYAPPPQQVRAEYATLDGLPAFADGRRRQFAGKATQVDRLTGFCLLARRELLDHIGGFDERFGTGFFEDDDLCVRARKSGYRLRLALGVYIHHFGSRTLAGLKIDGQRQLRENFERFEAKWGKEQTAGYRFAGSTELPAAPISPAVPSVNGSSVDTANVTPTLIVTEASDLGPPRFSLCMIVKNEENNLPDCLKSAADLFDEIVIVDTGSTDRTKEIAAGFGAEVVDFTWVDSFSAARNASIDNAKGDWIFWLDADDRLDAANREKLGALFAGLGRENAAYVVKCHCLPDPASGVATVVDHLRLFRNRPDVRWSHRVHEQILPALRAVGAEVRWADIAVLHTGYQDPAFRRQKLERDLRLLHLENDEQPDHPFTLFNLGSVYQDLGRAAEALPLLRRSLERSHPRDSIVRKLFALIVQCQRQLKQPAEALATCQAGRGHYPEDAELLFLEARVRAEMDDKAGAEKCLLHLIEGKEGAHFASQAEGLRGHKARHELAILYRDQDRLAEAEAQWLAALREHPGYLAAILGLGDLYLAQGRWGDVESVIRHLRATPHGMVEADVLEARGHLARKDFVMARLLLQETLAREPSALWPRVVLTRVLLEQGHDAVAAEKALRDVLELAPNHAEARHNLDLLLKQQSAAVTT